MVVAILIIVLVTIIIIIITLSMEFSRQEYWSGLPFPFPGDLPNPGIDPGSVALQADSLPTELQGRQYIKKQRHHFADKGSYSQSYGFSSSHEWM